MERYAQYKESGVEWIGEIPENWEVKKLKYGVTVNPSKDVIDKTSSELVVFLPMEKVTEDGKIDCSIKKPIFALYNGFTCFRKNDVIVAKITPCFENGKGAFLNKLETEFGFGSTEFHVLRVRTDVCDLFLYYVTKSEVFMKVGEAFMSGAAGQKRVPTDFIADFPLVSPSKPEQIAIANYLDRKTSEIDKLIAQKERLLSLYEEEKTTIINQAVTQGINPDVKLKNSNIDWLRDIPVHWKVTVLKRLVTKITDGEHISPKFTQIGMPFLSAKDVRDGYVQLPNDKFVDYDDGLRFRNRCNPELNDILLVSRGATVGRVAIIDTNTVFCLLGSVILLKPKEEILFTYFFYSLKNKLLQDNFLLASQSSAQQAIYLVDVGTVFLAIPSFEEQTSIVKHIEIETARINAKMAKTKKIITLQKEYRTALISEVVTGKIKVSHLSIGEVTS
jgi:type I restriction enzyme, S subunit